MYSWFYSKEDVRQTLAAYDPGPSWTELPGAGLRGVHGTTAFRDGDGDDVGNGGSSVFWRLCHGAARGRPGPRGGSADAGGDRADVRMKKSGPTLAAIVVALGFLSAVITFWRLGLMEFYRRGQASPDDLERLAKSSTMTGVMPMIFIVITGILCVGYLVWVRRYFRGNAAPATVS